MGILTYGKEKVLRTLSSSLTHVRHAFPYSFLFMIGMHLPQGKHAFCICLLCFYLMFYMCSPQG